MAHSLYARLAQRYGNIPTSAERRAFLKQSALVGAAAMLSIALPGCRRAGPGEPPIGVRPAAPGTRRVVVIGGGLAGLACAHELHAAGYRPVVFEARERLGGRVLTLDEIVPGARVEGGGELIGSNHPTWAAYAEKFGLGFTEITEPDDLDYPIVIDGRVLLERESLALYGRMEALARGLTRLARRVDPHEPWRSRDAEALDGTTLDEWIERADAPQLAKRAMRIQLEGDNGVAPASQSLLANLAAIAGGGHDRFWTESEAYRCEGGSDRLVEALAGPLLDAGLIRLRSPIARIEREASGEMVVISSAGERLVCDEVVLSIPPTLWGGIVFEPALPSGLSPQMGDASKQLFRVRGEFWKLDGRAAWSLSDDLYSWSWDGTDGRLPDAATDESPRCFTLFAGGPVSARARAVAPERREQALLDDIARAYPSIHRAFDARRWEMDWPSDPWTRGGYSMPRPGQLTTQGAALRGGFPGLRFAGEHCSTAFPGYMEGALESGVRVARAIAAEPVPSVR